MGFFGPKSGDFKPKNAKIGDFQSKNPQTTLTWRANSSSTVEISQNHSLPGHLIKIWCFFTWLSKTTEVSPTKLQINNYKKLQKSYKIIINCWCANRWDRLGTSKNETAVNLNQKDLNMKFTFFKTIYKKWKNSAINKCVYKWLHD